MDHRGIVHYGNLLKLALINEGELNSRGWVEAHCPFAHWRHEKGTDDKAAFGIVVNDEGYSRYYCYACKSKGTLPNLAFELGRLRERPGLVAIGNEIERAEFERQISFVPAWEGDEDQADEEDTGVVYFPTRAEYHAYNSAWWYKPAREYLRGRGFDGLDCWHCDLRWDPRQERILFPVKDITGRFRGYSGRSIHRNAELKVRDYFRLPKRELFLGEHRFRRKYREFDAALPWETTTRRNTGIAICEGLFDYARLRRHGLPAVALLGSALTDDKIRTLEIINEPIYWFVDPDQGGETALWGPLLDDKVTRNYKAGAVYQCHKRGLPQFLVEYPEGITDPGDQKMTKDISLHMFANAELFIPPPTWAT